MKTALYARVSRPDQNIETQLSYLRDYAKLNQLELIEVYTDVGVSGAKDSRPAFDKMLIDMRARKFKGILVYKLDRIGRSTAHLIKLFEEFKKRGIAFRSATQNINTSSPEGRMFLRMLMILAEYERELLIDRTNAGLARAKKEGKTLGRPKGSKDKKARRKSGYYLRYASTK